MSGWQQSPATALLILADGTVETNKNLRTDMPDGELPHRST
jgi:hypothetical protein